MRKILFIVLLTTFNINAQSSLDTLIFNKINEYRLDNGLNEIKWDQSIYYVGLNQATFCSATFDTITTQTLPEDGSSRLTLRLIDFVTEPDTKKRINKCATFDKDINVVEAASVVIYKESFEFENITRALRKENLNYLANELFTNWISSPQHDNHLLNPQIEYGSVSTVILMIDFFPYYGEDIDRWSSIAAVFEGFNFIK
jgi:hypothetical protein